MNALPTHALAAFAVLAIVACRAPREHVGAPPDGAAPQPAPPESSEPAANEGERALEAALVAREGVLQGGIMAIGGEHTGWVLREGESQLELDPGPWLARALELEGQRVRVRGLWQTLRYVERGDVRVLALRELAPAP